MFKHPNTPFSFVYGSTYVLLNPQAAIAEWGKRNMFLISEFRSLPGKKNMHGNFPKTLRKKLVWFTSWKIRGLRKVSEGPSLFTPANWREIQAAFSLKPVINSLLLKVRDLNSLSTRKHIFAWMSVLTT